MTRLLLWAVIVGVIVWWLMRTRRRAAGRPGAARRAQAFAECAHCGVHLPVDEAIVDGRRSYCSEAHRLAGPRPDA